MPLLVSPINHNLQYLSQFLKQEAGDPGREKKSFDSIVGEWKREEVSECWSQPELEHEASPASGVDVAHARVLQV